MTKLDKLNKEIAKLTKERYELAKNIKTDKEIAYENRIKEFLGAKIIDISPYDITENDSVIFEELIIETTGGQKYILFLDYCENQERPDAIFEKYYDKTWVINYGNEHLFLQNYF